MTSLRDDPTTARRVLDDARDRLVGLLEGEGDAAPVSVADQEERQQQEVAQDVERRRRRAVARIDAARERVETGEYGWCTACGEPIPEPRLKLDPAVALCIACAERA
jgi:DnaK suppressor protein